MICTECQNRTKTWQGDDPKCAFPNNAYFSNDNWNCALANDLREIIDPHQNLISRLFYPKSNIIQFTCVEEQKYTTINLYDLDIDRMNELCLWVSWYKNRGQTDAMWMLGQDSTPRVPTTKEIRMIIDALKKKSTEV